jgi:cell division protein FtsB
MRLFQLVLFVLATPLLVASAVNLSDEYQDWQEARQLQQRSQDELKDLEVERDLMEVQVEKLKTDELAKEQLARRLGYVKPDEIISEIANAKVEETSEQRHTR